MTNLTWSFGCSLCGLFSLLWTWLKHVVLWLVRYVLTVWTWLKTCGVVCAHVDVVKDVWCGLCSCGHG